MIAPLAALLRLHEYCTEGKKAPKRGAEVNRLRQSLSEELSERYDGLVEQHGAGAIAELDRGICTGCFMRQPDQTIQVEEDIYACQNCGRLLYDPDVAYDYSVG